MYYICERMINRKLANDELGRISVEEYKQRAGSGIVLVLDNIRSSHNIGSLFRSADSFGADKLYLCGICAVPPTAEIHKSALGAEFSVDWEYAAETMDVVGRLKKEGYTVVSIEQAEGSVRLDMAEIATGNKYALIFGNEVKGVQQEVVSASDVVWEIPQYGTKHSLNVSVSAGVVLWEVSKQLNN